MPNYIYQYIFENYLTPGKTPRKVQYAPGIDFVLAVSGAAASGKTTFCHGMINYLAKQKIGVVHVPLDCYLLYRKTSNQKKLSG